MTDQPDPTSVPMDTEQKTASDKQSKLSDRPPNDSDDDLAPKPPKKTKFGVPHSTPNLPKDFYNTRRHQYSVKLQITTRNHEKLDHPIHTHFRAWLLKMITTFGSDVIYKDDNGDEFDLHSLPITDNELQNMFQLDYTPNKFHGLLMKVNFETFHSMRYLKKPLIPWLQAENISMNVSTS